jgi:hypothetical protein
LPIREALAFHQHITQKIGFIDYHHGYFMTLDDWTDNTQKGRRYEKSLFPHERITLDSLRERILELEQMRDQVMYELDRLGKIVQNH